MAKQGVHPGGAHVRNTPRSGGKAGSGNPQSAATPRSKQIDQAPIPKKPGRMY